MRPPTPGHRPQTHPFESNQPGAVGYFPSVIHPDDNAIPNRSDAVPTSSDGEGRRAQEPSEIPARGWRDVAARTGKEIRSDQVPLLAAGVAFFGLLALVPGLAALISLYGLVGDPTLVEKRVGDLMGGAPREARQLVVSQARSILQQGDAKVGLGLALSIVLALWSASSGMKHLVDATNVAYDEDETRGFLKVRLLAVGLTIGALVLVGIALLIAAGLPSLAEDGSVGRTVLGVVRWPLLGLLVIVGLATLYRYAPDRDNPRWSWASPGALVATVLWVVGSIVFSIYTANFGKYNETYGALGAVVITMLWLFLTAFVVIGGAELNCETERQTTADSTDGRPRPLGDRHAYAADTIGDSD